MLSFVMADTSRLRAPGRAIDDGEGRLAPMRRPQVQLGEILRLAHRCQACPHVLKFEDVLPDFPRGHGTSVSFHRDRETFPLSASGLLALASMRVHWPIGRSKDSSVPGNMPSAAILP